MDVTINKRLRQLREYKPLILSITNIVTMDFIANGLLALGASPLMSQAAAELSDLLPISDALVINIGTLDDDFIRLAREAATFANHFKKPIIFDPVGAGASPYRLQQCQQFIRDFNIQVIRGNASEIIALADSTRGGKGVDSVAASVEAEPAARKLALQTKAVIFVSGEVDIITSAGHLHCCTRGSAQMAQVVGTGCLQSAVVAAFTTVEADPVKAARYCAHFYGFCGERAAQMAKGPGSFKTAFIDALSGVVCEDS